MSVPPPASSTAAERLSPAGDDSARAASPVPVPAPARWRNPWRAIPRLRWAVQAAYLAFLALVGIDFARFVAQVRGGGPVTAARPPAVEAFLPISALVGLRRWLATGYWDDVHPAGLTILLGAVATALLARKAFCGWVCPVGTISRALEWLGSKLLWRRGFPRVPRWLDLPLSGLKYVLLAFFVWTVFFRMPVDAVEGFMRAPYNVSADAQMLAFFGGLGGTAAAVLGVLVALSLVVKNAWCRWLCPYGGLLGLASLLSPLHVRRDPDTCNDCRACTRACPVEIPVHVRLRVLSTECTGCMSCVAACTVPDTLGVTRRGARALPAWLVPAVAIGTLLAFWAIARATGFWETSVSAEAFRWAYRAAGL